MFLKINWQIKCVSPKRNSLYWPLRRLLDKIWSYVWAIQSMAQQQTSQRRSPRIVHGQLYQSRARQLLILCLFAPGISQHWRSHPLADCAPFANSVISALPKRHTAGQLQPKVIQNDSWRGDALGHEKQGEVQRLGGMKSQIRGGVMSMSRY